MAEERHEPDVYSHSMQHLLQNYVVDTATLDKHITHYRNTVAERQDSWRMKHLITAHRPSMRAKLAITTVKCRASDNCLNGTGTESMTFASFCDTIRFPNCMSPLLRSRCYLLASQTHFDYRQHTSKFVSQDIANVINENPISFPHEESLTNGIDTLTLNMQPFEELKLFRKSCFVSYAESQLRGITMTDVLKLYVAAYQTNSMWKTLWKAIDPLMSTQISKDVETFVRSNQFATNDFIHILKTSSPF
jgi:hypothetical protein